MVPRGPFSGSLQAQPKRKPLFCGALVWAAFSVSSEAFAEAVVRDSVTQTEPDESEVEHREGGGGWDSFVCVCVCVCVFLLGLP